MFFVCNGRPSALPFIVGDLCGKTLGPPVHSMDRADLENSPHFLFYVQGVVSQYPGCAGPPQFLLGLTEIFPVSSFFVQDPMCGRQSGKFVRLFSFPPQ